MKKTVIISILTLLAGLFFGYLFFAPEGGEEHNHEHTEASSEGQGEETTYTCSMHPQIRQNEPGNCPICGMELIPVDEAGKTSETILEMSKAGTQLAEIQTTELQEQKPEKTIRMQGRVEVDERRISLITARFPGRIEKLFTDFTGERVSQGAKLASLYSPELISAQKELFEAMKYRDEQPQLYQAARNKLKLWNLSEQQIEKIEKQGQPKEIIDIVAPQSGIVTERKATLGEYVNEGTPLFKVADLSRVWVIFDAYEMDIPWLNEGDQIEFTVPSQPGESFQSKIAFIHPVMNAKTRTVEIRAEAVNPKGLLRPEMFANGTVEAKLPIEKAQLTVPKTAVMWTGKRSVAYVKVPNTEKPTFEFREVELGNDLGLSFIVEDGLKAGEKVVTHGTFKVDAAAQLAGKKSMMNRKEEKKQKSSLKKYEVSTRFKEKLTAFYEAYLPIKNALVASDGEKAKVEGQKALEVLKTVPMKELEKEEAHKDWMKRKTILEEKLSKMASTTNLEEQRAAFMALSNALSQAIQQFGTKGRKVYQDFCPMANDDKGAIWLSEIEEIQNPYYGEQMMSCGKVEKIYE